MDLSLLFKIVFIIVIIGIGIKALKFITSLIFKLALFLLIALLIYKIFIGF